MKYIFIKIFILSSLFVGVFANDSDIYTEEEIVHINSKIAHFKHLRNYYSSKVVRFRNKADRLQFQDNRNNIESKKLFKISDEYEQKVYYIDREINKLEVRRNKLIRKMDWD